MDSPPPRRTLRSSNRLSLSLSLRTKTKREKAVQTDKDRCQNRPDEMSIVQITEPKPSSLLASDLMNTESGIDNSCSPGSISSIRVEARSPEPIVISDNEKDCETPSKRSIPEFFTPYKHQIKSSNSNRKCTTGGKLSSVASSAEKKAPTTLPKKTIGKVRRKICPTTNIKHLTKKYFDDSQKRITNFFSKEENPQQIGYCRVLKESAMPTIITGDLDVEQMLNIEVEEAEDHLRFSQTVAESSTQAKGDMCPIKIMERIERVESACYDPVREDWNMERVQVPREIDKTYNDETTGDSGIACDDQSMTYRFKTTQETVNVCTRGATPKTTNKTNFPTCHRQQDSKKKGPRQQSKSKIVCPKYKIISGTNFAVDAFRYGNIEGVTHYFLTHFHADHYIGLKKSFCKPLVMSPITAKLVKTFINVPEDVYILIDLHQSIFIDGIEIIALDANHCPGGIMFLFRLVDGTNILHTGDFRASPEMEEYPEFWNMSIDCIYLDTTYLSSKYAFKSQWESVADARETVAAYLKKHIGTKVLVVCGSYLIGKEKVWTEIAISSNMKVWTEQNRWKALKAIADPNQLSMLIADPNEADIHVLAMNKLTYDDLNEHLNQFPDRYDSVIGIRPSGWEKNSKPQYRGRINIVGVEYSEHSSFDELKRFVQFLRPREVISTVPYGNSNQNRTPSVPISWYQGEIRPNRKELQLSITNFISTPVGTNNRRLLQLSSTSARMTIVKTKREKKDSIETKVEEVIDLVSDNDEDNNKRSENGEYSVDSDWLA
ncbi:uncharacterized protein LOC131292834 [Anopheles ziemanni]|uniref:uncharacterized protein LOC131271183 n=1 Tax=Anopheles coustani TaxID=139045 RepID=UPI00265A0614|nr:uncharacterized protein LOC131271183 [Anopheles coustani]XP_058176903.1 uncharacterized protein LOC131292834 [Anopheles ziemanni]